MEGSRRYLLRIQIEILPKRTVDASVSACVCTLSVAGKGASTFVRGGVFSCVLSTRYLYNAHIADTIYCVYIVMNIDIGIELGMIALISEKTNR